jgi:hypothetical protein
MEWKAYHTHFDEIYVLCKYIVRKCYRHGMEPVEPTLNEEVVGRLRFSHPARVK